MMKTLNIFYTCILHTGFTLILPLLYGEFLVILLLFCLQKALGFTGLQYDIPDMLLR